MLYKDFVHEKTHHLTRIKSAEGYPCEFDKSKGKALKNYKVYGKSIQNGTPTPESPVEIESVGNKSKNLLNVADYFSDFLDANGNMVFNQSNFLNIYRKFLLKNSFKENTQYTLSCTVEISNSVNNNGIRFGFYDSSNKEFTSVRTATTGSKTFNVKLTNDANTTISYIRISYSTSTQRCDVKISNFQIEEGATATEYMPYGKYGLPVKVNDMTTNIFLDAPLRRINVTEGNKKGNYCDYIDFKRGVVVRNTRQVALNGTERWTTVNDYTIVCSIYNSEICNSLCTHSQVIAGRYGVTWYIGATTYSNGGSGFMWNHGGKMTIDEWKAQLAQWYDEGNPLTVVCARITPTEETITLPPILTHKGSNIITTDTTVTPSNIEVKYIAK